MDTLVNSVGWSFGKGGRSDLDKPAGATGPGSYDPAFKSSHNRQGPNWTMRSKTQEGFYKNANPGPGTYEPTGGSRGPSYSMRPATQREGAKNEFPGPGTYECEPRSSSGPRYTMRPKPELHRDNNMPGPGAYDGKLDSTHYKNPHWRIGTEKRDRLVGFNNAPGPGQYANPRDLSKKGTRFGKDVRNRSASRGEVPGPGNYNPESEIDARARKKMGKTFGSKTTYGRFTDNPAPGAYDPQLNISRPSLPKYGFGSEARNQSTKNINPPPGTYDPKIDQAVQAAPSWRLGTAPQRTDPPESLRDCPGPGAYDPGLLRDKPKYSFGLKNSRHHDEKVPGPGTYDPTLDLAREHHQKAKIGTEPRGKLAVSQVPGPGNYHDPEKNELKKLGAKIGTEERGKSRTSEVPAPGTYDLPSDFQQTRLGKTFAPKLDTLQDPNPVGPGQYDPSLRLTRPTPNSRTFGDSRQHFTPSTVVPGPGTYENLASKTTPSWRVGTGRRSNVEGRNPDFPGPGTYDADSDKKKYKFAFGVKPNPKNSSDVPGPGHYEPKIQMVREKGPHYKVGSETKLKADSRTAFVPGPGHYEIDRGMKGKKAKFGSEPRGIKKYGDTPGPGYYRLPQVTGHMAHYYPNGTKIPSVE